jgi:hypothetical protein
MTSMKKRGYWKLKEEALDDNLWRTRYGRGCGAVVQHKAEGNEVVIMYSE